MERVVRAPAGGLWRVTRTPPRPDDIGRASRLPPDDAKESSLGNRFDSLNGDFGVYYFSSSLEGCFGETLARLRPHPELLALVSDEWAKMGFMEVGAVAADWRQRRVAIHTDPPPFDFLDADHIETHQVLRQELADLLVDLGYDDLDAGLVRARDRRITRAISQWAWEATDDDGTARFAGVRYLSRLSNSWECWAIFDDIPLRETARLTIPADMPSLVSVANTFKLTIH